MRAPVAVVLLALLLVGLLAFLTAWESPIGSPPGPWRPGLEGVDP